MFRKLEKDELEVFKLMRTIIKIIKKILRIESPSIVLMSDNKKKGK